MSVPNVLAHRYASGEMVVLFDPVSRVRLEREFWLAVLEGQRELGVVVQDGAVEAYRSVLDTVDLDSIEERERVLKHDVKARLEEFNALAGYQEIHKGLTSRDLTENVEQITVWRALSLIEARTLSLLVRLADLAIEYGSQVVVGRTHNVPAQPTTMGKRLAQVGDELLAAYHDLTSLRRSFVLRGIKGPVGSQQDQLDLLGSARAVEQLENRVAGQFGLSATMTAVGQVYPRSRDLAVVSTLVTLASAPANLALIIRLMAGHDLATEGFQAGQVGSSAMPHKMNTRSCERINGLHTILRGYLTMAAGLAGDQWNEGDVACSVVRRVVIPDSFFALDGIYETTFAVLRGFGVYPEVASNELRRYLPFLATTKLLVYGVRHGLGREDAHRIIKQHAVDAALRMRDGEGDGGRFIEALAADPAFPGGVNELWALIDNSASLLGLVEKQIGAFSAKVHDLAAERPDTVYSGADIL